MSRPVLLDLFCGAGGAAMGYHRAGFEVVGVDINPQPRYPFTFRNNDALRALRQLVTGETVEFWAPEVRRVRYTLMDFVAIHASPPCQGYTSLGVRGGRHHPLLVEPLRVLLDDIGLPYVIENVPTAPIRRDLLLCGEMFGLGVIRHRAFELGGWKAEAAVHRPHRGRVSGRRHGIQVEGPYFPVYGTGSASDKGSTADWQAAMGIDWTDLRRELSEAIPPAYTRLIGGQLLAHIGAAVTT